MKIGLISIEAGHNYGGILQCYALQQVLKKYGHNAEYIRCNPVPIPFFTLLRARVLTMDIHRVFQRLLHKPKPIPQEELMELVHVFDVFRQQYLNCTKHFDEAELAEYANANYGACIVGSDQVWTWPYEPRNVSFIGWNPSFKGKRLAYSSCTIHSDTKDWIRKKQLKKLFQCFDYISVRDKVSQQFVKNVSGLEAEIVPDPSELYDYKEFVHDDSPVDVPFIFVYLLGSEINGGHNNAIARIKKLVGDAIVVAVDTVNPNVCLPNIADRIVKNLSPNEWVNYIAHSLAVYTDSFHAILFSIKFKHPFIGFYKDTNRSSRLIDLKQRYSTCNIVNNVKQIERMEIIQDSICDKDKLFTILTSVGI